MTAGEDNREDDAEHVTSRRHGRSGPGRVMLSLEQSYRESVQWRISPRISKARIFNGACRRRTLKRECHCSATRLAKPCYCLVSKVAAMPSALSARTTALHSRT